MIKARPKYPMDLYGPWNWHHKCIIHDDFCLKKQTKMIEVFINVIVYEDNIHYF
jgi:hypothetical protein